MTDIAPPILLARHGETAWTRAGRYQGQSDPALSPAGVAESERLAATLRGGAIAAIMCSPLLRARQTAGVIAGVIGLPAPQIDPDLIEIAYGDWEGLTQADVKCRWPALLRAWKHAPETVMFPGGETLGALRMRVRRCLGTYSLPASSGAVLLVTHSAWIRIAVIEAQGLPLASFRHVPVATGSVQPLFFHTARTLAQRTETLSCGSR
ncbi:MAG: histidine phosphatase family protein [Proteobacteria bacterium]|nr:histidine phosphatase family protein [Pseudomonadota bacterium]